MIQQSASDRHGLSSMTLHPGVGSRIKETEFYMGGAPHEGNMSYKAGSHGNLAFMMKWKSRLCRFAAGLCPVFVLSKCRHSASSAHMLCRHNCPQVNVASDPPWATERYFMTNCPSWYSSSLTGLIHLWTFCHSDLHLQFGLFNGASVTRAATCLTLCVFLFWCHTSPLFLVKLFYYFTSRSNHVKTSPFSLSRHQIPPFCHIHLCLIPTQKRLDEMQWAFNVPPM